MKDERLNQTMSFPYNLPFLLDGATETHCLAAGMPHGVCTEQWILEHPEVLSQLQRAFVAAGSHAVLAPTFGANRARLNLYGLGDHMVQFNQKLVGFTRDTVGDSALVGGTLSPTGILPSDEDDEWDGDVVFEKWLTVYREQVSILRECGVDFLFLESMTSLPEARAALLAAKQSHLPVLCCLSADQTGHTLSGSLFLPSLITLQAMGADAVGLSCSIPEDMVELLEEARMFATVPLIAKADAGLSEADEEDRLTPEEFASQFSPLLRAGARVVGGCCGTTPEHISHLARFLPDLPPVKIRGGADDFVATREDEAFSLGDDIVLSDPIPCDYGLADALIDIEDEQVNVVKVEVRNSEEARQLAMDAQMSRLPISILSDDPDALDEALMLYHGRALVDSDSEIDERLLRRIAERYGAIVY
nr:homocysteine S-methyltransferase family protein [uncultured Solibaculum sp.]